MNDQAQQQLAAIHERHEKATADAIETFKQRHPHWNIPTEDEIASCYEAYFGDGEVKFLLTILADAERERDDANERRDETVMACELLQHRINFLEQNETVVWEVLQIPDGSTIHDVAAAVFKLRAELATATERAATAERELRVMLAPDRSNVRFHINGSELIAYWQVTSEDRDTVLCRSNGRFSDDLPGAIHTLYERVADAIERGEFREKGGGDAN